MSEKSLTPTKAIGARGDTMNKHSVCNVAAVVGIFFFGMIYGLYSSEGKWFGMIFMLASACWCAYFLFKSIRAEVKGSGG